MARYGNRKSSSSKDSSGERSGRGSRRSGGSRGGRNDDKQAEFVTLGDMAGVRSREDDDDYQDLTADLMDAEATYSMKVFVGKDETITLKNGDRVMVKFKEYQKAKEWVVGKVFLILED